jgi:hypothetical protein
MPGLEGILYPLKKDDMINGSLQLARAVWALGLLGVASSPAAIARCIRACTPMNWEGPQAAKFFRKVFRGPPLGPPYSTWFVRVEVTESPFHKSRYLYSLSDSARAYFRDKWTDGGWTPEKLRAGVVASEQGFRRKDQTPEGKDKLIRQLKEENQVLFDLLERIHTCHHGAVEEVMGDIDAYLKGAKGK